MQKRQIIIVGSAIGIVLFSVLLSSILSEQKEEPVQRIPPKIKKYVQTKKISYSDIKTEVSAYGRVRTAQSLDLLSEVSGRMYEGKIRLKAGQSFKKGTLLFYVDASEADLNLKSQKSNFLRDLAAIMPDLKIDFADNFDGWNKYFSELEVGKTFPELPKVKSEKEKTFIATKGIYSSYYTIKSAEVRLQKHKYFAPFDGSISEVVAESGSFINPGTRIGKIIRSGVHELQVAVETQDVPWIEQGQVTTIFSDETQQAWSGQVTRISDFVNQNTQSVDVFITIEPNGQKIYDGQFMRASVPARTVSAGMIVPRNIIYNGNEVFILQDTLLKTKTIKVYRTDEEIAIVGGLEEGLDLVIEPLIGAHNNMVIFSAEQRDIDMEGTNTSFKDGEEVSESNKN